VYQFLVTGEVVRGADPPGDELFENFRFRFEIPAGAQEAVPLVFQRYLRPGDYTVLVKVEDLFGRRYAGLEQAIEVPQVDEVAEIPGIADSELYQFLAEADAATARGERILRILPPPGVVHTGMVRFKTLTVGDIDRVVFLLDEQPILTKNRPPFSVELDLGDLPGTHTLRATGFDRLGEQVVTDEILLNPGGQRFRVRLVEPQKGRSYRHSLRAVADVQVPDGEELDRLELYLGEELIATLYQPPWVQPVVLAGQELAYVRAVAYLDDGNSAEELVFFNTPDFFEEVEVQFVELYATVHGAGGRPVLGLGEDDFAVFEDGAAQQIRRFEWVSDLPIHTVLLIDVSSSMEESLETVAEAADAFVEQTIEQEDRASLITFTSQPHVDVRFTNDVAALSAALEAMRAEGSTALYDSLVFALHYFHGIRGQKALLLLSDGKDEASGFDFDGALAYARRAGVTVYAIGLAEASLDRGSRRVLRQLADETGGRSFFVDDVSELAAIYSEIQEELRSQYLIAYQSSSTKDSSEFRAVTVEVQDDRKLDVRTMSGYYP
ncbi:MAG: VWA domain-containing protein, partial [Thermoanaerobaculia bacterium]